LGKKKNEKNCLVCGVENPASVRAEFYNCEDEDGEKFGITKFTGRSVHQSYPGRMHGGMIGALLDEGIGRSAANIDPNIWAVTIDLNVKFRKGVPLEEELFIISKITDFGNRSFTGEGKMVQRDGTVLATGVGKYFRLTLEQAAQGVDLEHVNRYEIEEDLPEFIEIAH
jgi:acyl-coenzyme A thioesterase PaaI-like protein